MPIDVSDIVVEGVYATKTNQHRKVIKIEKGFVHFLSRGGNVLNEWDYGTKLANPAGLEKFAKACDRIISKGVLAD